MSDQPNDLAPLRTLLKSLPIAMMNTAAWGLTPNQMIANGTQARPGIGRSSRTTQAVVSSAIRDMPVNTPSAMPRPAPVKRPMK